MSNILDKIKLSGVTYDIVDATAIHSMDGYWTSGQTQDAITAATGALAESIAEQHYQTSGDVQNAISGKADSSDVVTNVSGFTNMGRFLIQQEKNGEWASVAGLASGNGITLNRKGGALVDTIEVDTTVIAQKSDIPSVSGYADAVKYDTNTKYMKFYHGGTGGTEVFSFDASPFLIDGMVDNVEIKDVTISGESVTCLVISFNTAAGKQDINIPISEIFDASNYYTKDEVDAELSAKTDNNVFAAYTAATDTVLGGKASQSDLDSLSGTVTAHTADSTIHVTSSDKTTWSGKQDALVSGTNIKTINNESLLGSGNITISGGNNVEVSGTTLVFL